MYKTGHFYLKLLSILILTVASSCRTVLGQSIDVLGHYESRHLDDEERQYALENTSACITQIDFDILNGDKHEYRKFRDNCMDAESNGQLSCKLQRDWLIYGFIMAKVYQDTLAALDFAQNIEFMGVNTDSALGLIIVDCLEMASKTKPDIISCSATYRLIEIYREGLYGIHPDMEKVDYYSRLLESISSAIRKRMQTNTQKDRDKHLSQ